MSNEPSGFRSWLLRHVDDQSPVGDLARDVRDDADWPTGGPESFELYSEYLESAGACEGAVDALVEAWSHYDRVRA